MGSTTWAIFGAMFGAAATILLGGILWTALRTAQQQWDRLGTALPDGVIQTIQALQTPAVILDTSLSVVAVNEAAIRTGFVVEGALAVPTLATCAARARADAEPFTDDVHIPHRRGADSRFTVTVSPIGPRSLLMIGVDHTKEDQAEEVRRDFTANFSHELKTPIAGALLLTEALQAAADEPAQVRSFAETLNEQVHHLEQLVHDILELSTVENRTDRSTYTDVEVKDALEEAIDANQITANERRIALTAACPSGTTIWGDARLLVTILKNIIGNGIKYSTPGGHVGVGVARTADTISIMISDKGMGIPEEEQERIFERFYRGDKAHSTSEGTGLGLSIAVHAARTLGGQITVWSRPGIGSTFTISLPTAGRGTPAPAPDTASNEGTHHVTHPAH